MSFDLIIRPEAALDIEESYDWYEQQSEGLGRNFLIHIEALFNSIARRPTAFETVHKPIRRAISRRFPHAVFFLVEDERIVVIACMHHRRNPSKWERRI